ncbi:hypothetical protein ACI65C_011280 [Semiaphis heraclei]
MRLHCARRVEESPPLRRRQARLCGACVRVVLILVAPASFHSPDSFGVNAFVFGPSELVGDCTFVALSRIIKTYNPKLSYLQ